MDFEACNYDNTATQDDGTCVNPEFAYDCEGCIADTDGDGICDPLETPGCDDTEACNYDNTATDNDGTCVYPEDTGHCDCFGLQWDALGVCGGDCEEDINANGICDDLEIFGCMNENACNFNRDATDNPFDSCEFLSCIEFGCIDDNACNYNLNADYDDGSCYYANAPYDCDGVCVNDNDGDGVCDIYEIFGCQDSEACNYNPDATDDLDSCTYDCFGCIDPSACNFDATATLDDETCDYDSCIGCTDSVLVTMMVLQSKMVLVGTLRCTTTVTVTVSTMLMEMGFVMSLKSLDVKTH